MPFYVTLSVRSRADGQAQPLRLTTSDEWADRRTAQRKYRARIEECGASGAVASLVEEATDRTRTVLNTWTG
ncbi:hypothetical protein [Streptomyces sp. NPDC048350]|uniref:hypothetical protein n=1 Tax=Streptomyces sp. NPDC048350 TaxID=3365538 RepID=UPI003723E9D4